MRADLLEAKACVDWAISKLPEFRFRIDAWLGDNVYVAIEDQPAPATHNVVVAVEKEFLPFSFNVEFGAYINTIRSALDILAVVLARRHSIPRPDSMYFPIVANETVFIARNFKGKELVNGLPKAEQTIIENLKPYQGGCDLLWLLHQLDIKRKHQRLLSVKLGTIGMSASTDFPMEDFIPDFRGWVSANNKTLLGLLCKGVDNRTNYDLKVTSIISLHEPTIIENKPVIELLYDFASVANSIIRLFDY